MSRYGSYKTGQYKSKTQFCTQNRRKPPLPVSSRKVLFCFCKMTRYGSCKTRQYKSKTLFCFCFCKMTRNGLNECKTIELNRILVKTQKNIFVLYWLAWLDWTTSWTEAVLVKTLPQGQSGGVVAWFLGARTNCTLCILYDRFSTVMRGTEINLYQREVLQKWHFVIIYISV
jgi:hypothetical protein